MVKPVIFEHKSWKLYRWTARFLAGNIYLILPEGTDEAMLVDAGGRAGEVVKTLKKMGKRLKWIVLTHRHHDHTGAAWRIKLTTRARIIMGKGDSRRKKSYSRGGKAVGDGDVIPIGSIEAKIIATPGHTRDGISILLPEAVFTGDTLFAGGIGRTDLRGGSLDEIFHSINEKLLTLPDDTAVYPGHGPPSTIGEEKISNPFLTGRYKV